MRIQLRVARPGIEPILNRTCPSCGYRKMHVHEQHRNRRIVDWKLDTVHQVRVKCPRCGKTATCRPDGIKPGLHRTGAVVTYGIMLYAFGLSFEAAAAAIRALTGHGSKTAIYRDVVAAGSEAQKMHEARAGMPVRIVGIDGTGQKLKGGSAGVAFAVDAEEQVLLAVELVEEDNPRQVRRFIKKICNKYCVDVIITDEHDSYEKTMQSNDITAEHRLCQTHWKKSKQLRIKSLKKQAEERGWDPVVHDLDELRRLIKDNPPSAIGRIQKIHDRYLIYQPPKIGEEWTLGFHMRMLTLHLLEKWRRVGTDTQPTNNTAERMIGLLLKIRSKTMRGFAKPENIIRFAHLAAYLRENRKMCI